MNLKNYFNVFLFVLLIFLMSCNKKTKIIEDPNSDFGSYLTEYTSGLISRTSNIKIKLTNEISLKVQEGELPRGIFTTFPKLQGKAFLSPNNEIYFHPTEMMRTGITYKVIVNLDKIIKDVVSNCRKLIFSFQTIPLDFKIENTKLISESQNIQKFQGTVFFSDFVKQDDVKKILSIEYNGYDKNISWSRNALNTRYYFTVDSLARDKEVVGKLKMIWDGNPIKIENKGALSFSVLPKNEFKVTNIYTSNKDGQSIVIEFSDLLDEKQNIDGLVTISDNISLKYIVSKNTITVYPDKHINKTNTIFIEKGIRSKFGKLIDSRVSMELDFSKLPPSIALLGKGVISPSSQGLIIPFKAVCLNAVDLRLIEIHNLNLRSYFWDNKLKGTSNIKRYGRLVLEKKIDLTSYKIVDLDNWNAFSVDISDFYEVSPGALYIYELRFNKAYSRYKDSLNISPIKDSDLLYINRIKKQNKWEKEQDKWDNPGWYSFYYVPDNYVWSQRNDPTKDSYYTSDKFVSNSIFASDLGVVAKRGTDNSIAVAVSSLITAKPIDGVSVSFYSYQNQLISKAITNKNGFLFTKFKTKPYLLVAKLGKQVAYLRLDDGSSLSLSNFNVGGDIINRGIKGSIFAERGVWSPGDSIHLTFILDDIENPLPENYPAIFELTNPLGQIYDRQVISHGENGFYTFITKTPKDANTGIWKAKVTLGSNVFYKNIRIEVVKSNRLKMDLNFNSKILNPFANKADLKIQWLHGGKAKNLKSLITLNLNPTNTVFKGLEDYSFDDDSKLVQTSEINVYKGRVDSNGLADIQLNFPSHIISPGIMKAHFKIRAFEDNGNENITYKNIKFSPYNSYIGLKMQTAEDEWYLANHDTKIDIVTVDENGKYVSLKNLKVSVYKLSWSWWWDASDNNIASYVNNYYKREISTKFVSTTYGKGSFTVNIPYNNWKDFGRYLIRVEDPLGGHSSSVIGYFSDKIGYLPSDMPNNASVLSFKSDKEEYNVGDKAIITIPSSKNGRALVSIENGTRVISLFWLDTKAGTMNFPIDITSEMAPNSYVFVSLIQPHGQTDNDCMIRMYGVIPLNVKDKKTKLDPIISMPKVLRPNRDFKIKVQEKNGKKMTYTLAVVDEGLLDITAFSTPNPWNAFYSHAALGVKTWDMYDYVLGAFGIKMQRVLAVGGDASIKSLGEYKINRFSPVTMFVGPFTLLPGESRTHKFHMPNYIGAVKTMLLAGNKGSYGSSEFTSNVKEPLMVLATLPRILACKEKVRLPVSVFVMEKGIADVVVSVKTNNLLKVVGESHKSIHFDGVDEKLVYFDLEAVNSMGKAEVEIVAQSGSKESVYNIELDLRNPNPEVVSVKDTILKSGQKLNYNFIPLGIKNTNKATLVLSHMQALNLGKYLNFSNNYYENNLMDIVSRAMIYLHLPKIMEITPKNKTYAYNVINYALVNLLKFQNTDGSFSYLQNSNYASDELSSFVGLFMLKAEEMGYTLSLGVKDKWIKYQENESRLWKEGYFKNGNYIKNNSLLQAYRLFTLAYAGNADIASMNRLKENKDVENISRWCLASAYYIAGYKTIADEEVTHLLNNVNDNNFNVSDIKAKSIILTALSLLKRDNKTFELTQAITKELNSNLWISRKTFALCLMAMSLDKSYSPNEPLICEYRINKGKLNKVSSKSILIQSSIEVKDNNIVYCKNNGKKDLYLQITQSGIPIDNFNQKIVNRNMLTNVYYEDLIGNMLDIKNLKQGQDFIAIVKVRDLNIVDDNVNMKLKFPFPSGWEILDKTDIMVDNRDANYININDNAVNIYFKFDKYKTKVFKIRLNASYVGDFYLPILTCRSLSDNDIFSQIPGCLVRVVD